VTDGGALRALWPAGPLLVWAAHFGAVYAAHAYACERGMPAALVQLAVVAATVLAIAALCLFARPGLAALRADGGERPGSFARWFAAAASLAAALAVLFQATPAFVIPACR
jgi:hypothetical protein